MLDDVLVNFDTERAKAAATVLTDFARGGFQVLLFTCHEHIVRIFQQAHVPVRQLPARGENPQVLPLNEEPMPPANEFTAAVTMQDLEPKF